MKALLKTVETYRTDTEEEAKEIIDAAAKSSGELTKKVIELKTKTSKGVVIDQHFQVTVTVNYMGLFDDIDESLL